ncbi:uncharacterized protein RHO25_004116 [Cercospora beticola]|uniref:Uncharacterized protein n=1 Tax=Cercospora beticola TaxID=122368 RepID=A0ABZ0NIY0_CERBT|nr:hypothetical protein RHO25_004116 [Cercospora beticola]
MAADLAAWPTKIEISCRTRCGFFDRLTNAVHATPAASEWRAGVQLEGAVNIPSKLSRTVWDGLESLLSVPIEPNLRDD